MADPRPVLFLIGMLLVALGLAMLLPVMVDLAYGDEAWPAFLSAAGLTVFFGGGLSLSTWRSFGDLSIRQLFLFITGAWLVLPAFAALPFYIGVTELGVANAFFEAMSGLTTTGSTIFSGLDTMARGLLLWRAMLNWLGGFAVLAMAVALLPMLGVGGTQLFRMELGAISEKTGSWATIGSRILFLYVALTVACIVAYYLLGMTSFDAVTHAMATVATGGFSPHDQSFAYFQSAAINYTCVVFMIAGSLPFLMLLAVLRGNRTALTEDTQTRAFFGILAVLTVLVLVSALAMASEASGPVTFDLALFNTVAVMTGTGFAVADYNQWGTLAVVTLFFAMFIGGCAGSTTCGIKVFRYQILIANLWVYLQRLAYPSGVFTAKFGRTQVSEEITSSVLSFFFLFLLTFLMLAVALSAFGLDSVTAISGAATALTNVGPGLGQTIGPAGNFTSLPDGAKWLLAFGMLLGRLELFPVLVLFSPRFWRT